MLAFDDDNNGSSKFFGTKSLIVELLLSAVFKSFKNELMFTSLSSKSNLFMISLKMSTLTEKNSKKTFNLFDKYLKTNKK